MKHNFCTKYGKILEICKQYSKNLVNELGNTTKRGVVPKFSCLEPITLSLTAKAIDIDVTLSTIMYNPIHYGDVACSCHGSAHP